jgi:hypothetical protein
MSPEGVQRRRGRVTMRKRRAMQTTVVKKQNTKKTAILKKQNKRSNRRTKRLPCCGKERRYCKCFQDYEGPQEMFSMEALKRQAERVKQSDMLTAKDPKDMSFILPLLDMQRISIHRFLFNLILFRMYSKKETYVALEPFSRNASVGSHHTRDSTAPDWIGMQKKLAELYARKTPVWGGMFYPSTLIASRSSTGNWKHFKKARSPKDQAYRDMHGFRCAWIAITQDTTPQTYIKALQRCCTTGWKADAIEAGRLAFAQWYDNFYDYMSKHTKGWFGDYAMKLILDVGCQCRIYSSNGSTVFPDVLLSRWPVNCPAYRGAVVKMLKPKFKKKKFSKNVKWKSLMYVHAVLSKELGGPGTQCVPTTLAQLCWQKRAVRGT